MCTNVIYRDNHITLYNSDCRDMKELSDNSIHCVVTSPPYFGLRRYDGLPDSIWDEWKGQFGLEPTIEMYVNHSIEILREIKRVLRKDGVVFWNIGDSYAGSGNGASTNPDVLKNAKEVYNIGKQPKRKYTNGIKPKDLCLIPFRVALAAQADGWWVRSDIIWNKPNPMPESVLDRPTDSYEHIFMFTKSAKYYWNIEAVREPQLQCSIERMKRNHFTNYDPSYPASKPQRLHQGEAPLGDDAAEILGGRNIRNVWTFPTQGYQDAHFATFPEELPERCIKAACPEDGIVLDPFGGSGTTGWVAKRLNRKCVMYEASPQYCDLIIKRNQQQAIGV